MRNPAHSVVKTPTAILALTALCFVSLISTASAQCSGNCSGRCTYGVEGTCTPKSTYGHHVTTWRQWPEKAPAVPKRMPSMSGKTKGNIQLDLPAAGDESDSDPEFSHLKSSSDLIPPPMSDYSIPPLANSYSAEDDLSVNDFSPVSPGVDSGEGAASNLGTNPSEAVDLPSAEVEGESSGSAGDLLDGPSPILNFESRIRPNPTRSVAVVSHQAVDTEGNPLRLNAPFRSSTTTESFKPTPLRSVPLGNANRMVNRTRNPLR